MKNYILKLSKKQTTFITSITTTSNNQAVLFEWKNPLGCYDEVLIVMSDQTNTFTPTGDGTQYTAVNQFGQGTQVNNSYVVYKGTDETITIDNLQNGIVYNYEIFARFGTIWSAGISGFVTPDVPQIGWQINQANVWKQINFDQSVPNVNEGIFTGLGVSNQPQSGMLHSNAWRIAGLPDFPNPNFGDDLSLFADFARGQTGGGITTRGLWSFEVAPNNFAMGVQPITSAFNPGTITLRWENKTGATITDLEISYTFFEYNDQDRSSYWQFLHSPDGVNFQPLPETFIETKEIEDNPTEWEGHQFYFKLSNLNIPDGEAYYFQWESADLGGSGSRDELALDDIELKVHHQTPIVYDPKSVSGRLSSLYVAENLKTQILPNSSLEVEKLNLEGELLILADASGYGQLLHEDILGTGTLSSQLYISGATGPLNGAWHYLSFPSAIPYQSIHDGISNFDITNSATSPIFEWDAAQGDWVLPTGGETGNFEPGKGYTVYFGENATGTYTRPLPTTVTLTQNLSSSVDQLIDLDYTASPNFTNINGNQIDGWNFIGNPFLSVYDLYQNNTGPQTLASAVRRNATNTGFETYVFTEPNVASRYIAPHQAFWVRTTGNTNQQFSLTRDRRRIDQSPIRTKSEIVDVFFLEVVGPQGVPDEARIYFREDATEDFDRLFDGDKLPNDKGYPNMYTLSKGIPFSVNSLPPIDEMTLVPLHFECDCSGLFRIRLKETNGFTKIYLKEKHTSSLIDLADSYYEFNHSPSDGEKQLELVFSREERSHVDWRNYNAWFSNGQLNIQFKIAEAKLRYRLTDIHGRYLIDGTVLPTSNVHTEAVPALSTGVYLLYIEGQEGGTEIIKLVKP